MSKRDRPMVSLERRIRDAESDLFAVLDAEVEERFFDLKQTDPRVRVLSHGSGAPLLLLHGVSLSAAAWAPLFAELRGFRLLTVDLPGHGLSDPVRSVVGHSLGGMFASGMRPLVPSGSRRWPPLECRRSRSRESACGCRYRC